MTPEETEEIRSCLISAIKELGEVAECIIKEDNRPDHWKNELGDLCGLAILPMLDVAEMSFDEACVMYVAGMSFEEACDIGVRRKREKMRAQSIADQC